ncbi:hypothetical protein ACFUNF_38275 [Streptomyces sp. NPDC057291]|uniref:hypothetical protein n=1 Tax=Streptomyces sp. NPDC057291 TaxID=3346087 RepID=UPI003626D78F
MSRELETAITNAVVIRQEPEAVAKQSSDPLLASILAPLTYKHDGTDQLVCRAFDVA